MQNPDAERILEMLPKATVLSTLTEVVTDNYEVVEVRSKLTGWNSNTRYVRRPL